MNFRNYFVLGSLLTVGAHNLFAANLVTNPGFESGTTGWITWGSTITASTEQKRSGSYSCLNTARTADWQSCVQDLTGKLTVGTTYRISAWVRLRNVVAERAMLLIKTTYAGGDHYFNSENPLVSNDAWTPLVFYYTHAGTGSISVNFYVAGPAAGVEFFVDDVTVEAVYDPQAVGVDLSVTNGAVTQRGSGFLFGLSATDPATNYYEPLKPKLQRDRPALLGNAIWGEGTGFGSPAFMNRVQQAGAKHQVLISDDYCWDRNYQNTWGWPGDAAHNGYGPYDLLDQTIDALMASVQANGYQVEWDIWNEPDPTYGTTFWGRDQAQFFATWKHAYQRIRSNDPNAVIVGPSVTSYVAYLTNFLLYAQSKNVLPDVVSWHELSGSKSINADVQAVRAFMASNGMPARPIDINEYIGNTEWSNPGIHTCYLAALERANVRRAAHSVWDEVSGDSSSGGIFPGRLAHLLTRDTHQPRAVWQVYKAYADLAGNMVQISPGIQIDGVAATATNGIVRMILGNNSGDTNTVNLAINRLDLLPYYNATGAVRVIVQRIPNTGTAALSAPVAVSDTNITLTTNSLTLPLSFGPAEVLLVKVEIPSYTTNWSGGFVNGATITDNSPNGWLDTRTVSNMPAGTLQSVAVNLQLTGGWNGDLYAYLKNDTGFVVLLNRVGQGTGSNPTFTYGYGNAGMNVTFADNGTTFGEPQGNIHNYGGLGTPSGLYNPDSTGAGGLGSFLGGSANGNWTLFIADLSVGGTTTVQSWGLQLAIAPGIAPPVAIDATYQRLARFSLKIAITNLLSNASDPNGYPLTLQSFGPSTNSATLTSDGANLFYTNTNAQADRFPYTVSNGHGGTATANVFITINTNSVGRVQSFALTTKGLERTEARRGVGLAESVIAPNVLSIRC